MPWRLDQPVERLDQVWSLIKTVPTGSSLLGSFRPLLQRGQINLDPYPESVVQKMRQYLKPGHPIGAALIQDGTVGTIYYDVSSPIGVLAPYLVHEMVHALDPELWLEARRSGPPLPSRRNQTLLRAEVAAFNTQHRFVQELRANIPEYARFLDSRYPHVRVLIEHLTQDDIVDLYQLGKTTKQAS